MTQEEILIHDKNRDCLNQCIFDGYDTGAFQKDLCYCANKVKYSDLVKKKFKITSQLIHKSTVINENNHQNASLVLPVIDFEL